MALTKCLECEKEVSTKADACPHCGAKRRSSGGGCVLLFLVVLLFGGWFLYSIFKTAVEKQIIREERVPGSMVFAGQKFGRGPNLVALVADDYEVIVEIGLALGNNDTGPMFRAIESGKATLIRDGTQGVIVDNKTVSRAVFHQVKISDGELAGKYIWTHSSFVLKR